MSAATHWYAVVDAASDPGIAAMARAAREHACLFSGALTAEVAAVSPYLAKVDPHEPLLHAWQERGQGKHWGWLAEAELDLEGLRRHLRRFLQAKLPDGDLVTFRFYDPRVFRSYLRSAPADQCAAWFTGVRQFVVEGDEGRQHHFRWRGGRLFDGDQPVAT